MIKILLGFLLLAATHANVFKNGIFHVIKDIEIDDKVKGWSDWSGYLACSVTCGCGIKKRTRTCTNPAPSRGGNNCVGDFSEAAICNLLECPINGGWSHWGDYLACSTSCGCGIKIRTRNCTNPAPSRGGNSCAGDFSEAAICNLLECPTSTTTTSAPTTTTMVLSTTNAASKTITAPTTTTPTTASTTTTSAPTSTTKASSTTNAVPKTTTTAQTTTTAPTPTTPTTGWNKAYTVAIVWPSVHKVAIKALVNGLFVCAENAGQQSLIANRGQIGLWETFEIRFTDPQTFTLKSLANGKLVCAENNGQSPLIANSNQIGPWETFTLVQNKEGVAFKSHANGKLVTAENNLIANRDIPDIWERFVFVYL